MIRYRNRRTGELVETLDPQPVYDLSPRWARVDDEPPHVEPEPQPQQQPEPDQDLRKLRRGELNELAARVGVEEPDKLANAGEVIAAIEALQH